MSKCREALDVPQVTDERAGQARATRLPSPREAAGRVGAREAGAGVGGLFGADNSSPHPRPLPTTRFNRGGRGAERARLALSALIAVFVAFVALTATHAADRKLEIGRVATPAEVAGWDIDVRPDGQGLPPGKGSVKDGEEVYMAKCAACHGEFGESAGRWPMIAGGRGTLTSHDPTKTVGSYFPYLSSVFDYIRHAMPFGDSQSMTNDELYAVVAYTLFLNDIVDDNFVFSKDTFASVKMPNAAGFFDDDRETSEKSFWNASPCMKDCKPPATVTGRARVIDVTPDEAKPKPPRE